MDDFTYIATCFVKFQFENSFWHVQKEFKVFSINIVFDLLVLNINIIYFVLIVLINKYYLLKLYLSLWWYCLLSILVCNKKSYSCQLIGKSSGYISCAFNMKLINMTFYQKERGGNRFWKYKKPLKGKSQD